MDLGRRNYGHLLAGRGVAKLLDRGFLRDVYS